MLDQHARTLYRPVIDRLAVPVAAAGVSPGAITATSLVAGAGACVSAALRAWTAALVLWLVGRLLDGLDGALARRGTPSDLGGLLDFLSDTCVYAGFVLGVAIAMPHARVACVALLGAYLLNSVALLGFASLVERRGLGLGDERSLRFTPGLAEGTETIVAYAAICLTPTHAELIAWVFAGLVLGTVVQRVALAVRTLA